MAELLCYREKRKEPVAFVKGDMLCSLHLVLCQSHCIMSSFAKKKKKSICNLNFHVNVLASDCQKRCLRLKIQSLVKSKEICA